MPKLVFVNDIEDSDTNHLLDVLKDVGCTSSVHVVPTTRIDVRTQAPTTTTQVQFKVANSNLNGVIKALNANAFSNFDITDVLTSESVMRNQHVSRGRMLSWLFPSSRDRLSTLEIHSNIVACSHLSFDHCFFVFIASGMAAIGLLTDSPVVILAAFFVSPLMNMIMACVWGAVIGDRSLMERGGKNMLMGACIAWTFGCSLGCFLGALGHESDIVAPIQHGAGLFKGMSINAAEVLARGPPTGANLVKTTAIACLSGTTIALGQSSGVPNALAGVTLAVSLLPPLVNSGICFSLSYLMSSTMRTKNGYSLCEISLCSMGIYLVTVPSVMFFAWSVFKFKHIGGLSFRVGTAQRRDWSQLCVTTESYKLQQSMIEGGQRTDSVELSPPAAATFSEGVGAGKSSWRPLTSPSS